MRFTDTIRLAVRNLIHNASHFVLSLLSLILLSVLVMTISNFCWIYHTNSEANDVRMLNENGLTMSLAAEGRIDDPARYITSVDQSSFLDFIEGLNYDGKYSVYSNLETIRINGGLAGVEPYIGRLKPIRSITVTDGAEWTKADEGKPHIWLSADTARTLGAVVGDTVKLSVGNGKPADYTVKGIVNDYYSFIDIKNFTVTSISITDSSPEIKSFNEIKALRRAFKEYDKTLAGGGSNRVSAGGDFMYSVSDEIGGFIYALCAALIAVSIGVCLVCILRTLRTNIENNNNSLGLMKALGAKNRDMKAYILTQIILLILVGTVIATLISCLVSYVALGTPIEILMGMIFTEISELSASADFWFVLPLLNAALLGGVVSLASIPMLRRYMKIDAIKIINEGSV